MNFDIEILRVAAADGKIQWHLHALERLLERGISRAEILEAIITGEVIAVYKDNRPYPSCLILFEERDPLHVVAAADPNAGICHIITAYRPSLDYFEPGFRTRRKIT